MRVFSRRTRPASVLPDIFTLCASYEHVHRRRRRATTLLDVHQARIEDITLPEVPEEEVGYGSSTLFADAHLLDSAFEPSELDECQFFVFEDTEQGQEHEPEQQGSPAEQHEDVDHISDSDDEEPAQEEEEDALMPQSSPLRSSRPSAKEKVTGPPQRTSLSLVQETLQQADPPADREHQDHQDDEDDSNEETSSADLPGSAPRCISCYRGQVSDIMVSGTLIPERSRCALLHGHLPA